MNYEEPDLVTASSVINNSLKRNELITIYCECSVKYEGRAYSKLDKGDRLIIIKPDKTLLIHKPSGRNPVNWIKSGASIKTIISDSLIISAESINPREQLIIKCSSIKLISSLNLSDDEEIIINGTEADMSRMLYDNPSIISDNFIPVSLEEQTRYGFIDVLGHDGNGGLFVVECKRVTASLSAVQQLRRYVERLMKSKGTSNITGFIAAPSITKNALRMLNDFGYKFIRVNPPSRNIIDNSVQKKLSDF